MGLPGRERLTGPARIGPAPADAPEGSRKRAALLVGTGLTVLAVLGLSLMMLSGTGAPRAGAEGSAGPLHAPKTTALQDNQYVLDVTKADSQLASYVQQQGDTGLQALVTDGAAFCAFLARGGGLDNALASVAIGARSIETQTSLPLGVATFNTIESVALVVLCPGEQALLPASVRGELAQLKTELPGGSS